MRLQFGGWQYNVMIVVHFLYGNCKVQNDYLHIIFIDNSSSHH
jgi:hypothetical protein